MDEIDHARTRYAELLLRHSPTLDDQIKDLAKVPTETMSPVVIEAAHRRRGVRLRSSS